MAKVFLNKNEVRENSIESDTIYFGASGEEVVRIGGSVTNLKFDQNVERVTLSGALSNYTYQQAGNNLQVHFGSTIVATIVLQDDDSGTRITFSDGTINAMLIGQEMKLGDAIVNDSAHTSLTVSSSYIDTSVSTNEAPVVTSSATVTVAENVAVTSIVYTASDTDVNAGDTSTFTLTGTDAALFNINGTNGEVTLKNSADFETKSSYAINVVATDAGGLTGSKAVTVAVTNVNEAPVVTSTTTGTVAENAAINTVVYTATASDVDAADTKTFSLTGTDAALFNINGTNGEVTLKNSADFETKSSYAINVVATDAGGLTGSKAVTVAVTNVNEAPVVTSAATGTVAENAAINTVVYTATASDFDVADTKTFSLTGTDAALFNINGTNGEVTLKNSADFETKSSYAINVVATDAGGLTGSKAVTVAVTNVNEAPVVTSTATGTVAENAATNTVVYTATATDVDAADTKTFTLSGADAALFNINGTNGEVTLKNSADFETKNSYDFNVVATDAGGLTGSKAVTVAVTNVNEAPPNVAPVITSAATGTIAENAAINTVVYTATATDADAGDTKTFSLTGTDAALFNINGANGEVTLKNSADFETKSSYAINVIATDAGGLTGSKAVTVNVTNVNEAPVITSAATGTVAENAAINTVVYTATATDVDAADTRTFTLTGADAALFNINGTNGEVTLKNSADFETKSSYDFNVVATDSGGLTGSKAVTVAVTNVNEAPVVSSAATGTVAENAAINTVVYAATATDVDAADTRTFSLTGTDAALFDINGTNGDVTLKNSADFETKNTYDFNVVATDAGGLTGSKAVTVAVTNVNEAPVITSAATGTVAENAAINTVVYAATATDVDAADTKTFSLAGTDAALFDINGTNGEVTLKNSADFETKNSYDFNVVATDAGGLTGSKAVTVGVTDVHEIKTLTGTAGDDTYSYATSIDDFTIKGLAGNDTINTGLGNDIIRPGEGMDSVNTGAGNDIVVVVGQTAAGQYVQSDISNPAGTGIDLSNSITLADLNDLAVSELVAGESIDGGAGINRLVIYGNADLTGVTLNNISQLQVNSTVTITAQQLSALGLTAISGGGVSILNITNAGADPVLLDLSGIQLTDFRSVTVGNGVTLVVDQADVADLKYIAGNGTIQASTGTGTLDLTGKYITAAVNDKDGLVSIATAHHGNVVAGTILIGSESVDTLTGGASDDRLEGGYGNDVLVGGDGNDILRGGHGIDSMDGGAGNDTFVVVGDISSGGKVDSVADTAALGQNLTDFNGLNLNEDEDGAIEVIRGGDGEDTLYVYGSADISHYDMTGIEHIEIRSDVTFSVEQLRNVLTLNGDGFSILRVVNVADNTPAPLDLSTLALGQLGQLSVGENVSVLTPGLSQLGGAHTLSGLGSIAAISGTLDLTGIALTTTLDVRNADNTLARGSLRVENAISNSDGATVVHGTSGNDYIVGSSNNEKIIGGLGADVIYGSKGNDVIFGDNEFDNTTTGGGTSTPVVTNTLVNGLGGASGFGENSVYRNDDGYTAAIDIRPVFGPEGFDFYGTHYTSAYVNTNGNITFRGGLSTYTPGAINAGLGIPIIAPFWADVDTRGGAVTASPGGVSTGSNLAWYDIDPTTKTMTVTWDDVGYYSYGTNKLNTFQLQLVANDNGNTDIIFRYEDVNWTTGSASGGSGGLGGTVARAGYSAGYSQDYQELPQSGNQAEMLALDTNSLAPFQATVNNGFALVVSDNDTIYGGEGNDTIHGGVGNHDVAYYTGNYQNYTITPHNNYITISDNVYGRDGVDTVDSSTEYIKFADIPEMAVSTLLTHDGAVGITDSHPFELLAEFAQAAYWTRPEDRDSSIADGNSGQEMYDFLQSSDNIDGNWRFLGDADLHYDPAPPSWVPILPGAIADPVYEKNHNGNVYFENGGVTIQSEVDANNLLSATDPNRKSEQSLIHGSAAAVVAVRGDSLVISFRGTEDVPGPGSTLESNKPIAQAVVRYALESNYGISADDIATGNYDLSLNDRAAHDSIQFLKTVINNLSHGISNGILDGLTAASASAFPLFTLAGLVTAETVTESFLSNLANDNTITKTDSYYWIHQDEHYKLLEPLVTAVSEYVLNQDNGIQKVYVTGHSLGGGMASWYMTDATAGGHYLQDQGIQVFGASFAPPGALINSEEEQRTLAIDDNYFRFEVARDPVPDATDIALAGESAITIHSSQPGLQLNLVTDTSIFYNDGGVLAYHAMANYSDATGVMSQAGLLDDIDYLISHTNVEKPNTAGFYDPIVLNPLLSDLTVVGDGGPIYGGENVTTGDSGSFIGEYSGYAEKWSENDIIVGRAGSDTMYGDGGGSVQGTNDIFYLGAGGNDTVYGDNTDDDGGLDTVVYSYESALINGNINSTSISGSYVQDRDHNLTHDVNTIHLNIDGSADTLSDIEQFHFISAPSSGSDLLAGDSSNNTLNAQNGNDYLYGSAGNDTLTGGTGNDRIHGGAGDDTAIFEGNAADYTFSVSNYALQIKNTNTGETDSLYSVENIKFSDTSSVSAAEIIWKGQGAFSTETLLLPSLDSTLLDMYAPIFAYSDDSYDWVGVRGQATTTAAGTYTLSYVVMENDADILDTDLSGRWWYEIDLGKDLLPTSFISHQPDWDNGVQVRNPFDTELIRVDDHPVFFVKDGESDAWLTEYDVDSGVLPPEYDVASRNRDSTVTWLAPDDVTQNAMATHGLGDTFGLKGSADTWKQDTYALTAIGESAPAFDYEDPSNSELYTLNWNTDNNYVMAGLPSGDMAMGYLFQDTPIAPLGHFDLV